MPWTSTQLASGRIPVRARGLNSDAEVGRRIVEEAQLHVI